MQVIKAMKASEINWAIENIQAIEDTQAIEVMHIKDVMQITYLCRSQRL